MTGNDEFTAGWDESIDGTNVASGNAHVDTQANYIHNHTIVHSDNTFVNSDNSPKETLRIALNYLSSGEPQPAEDLIADALARDPGLFSTEVAYYRVLATVGGRSVDDLDDRRYQALRSCFDRATEHVRDQWCDALDVVEELLNCLVVQEEHGGRLDPHTFEHVSVRLGRLPGERREEITRHLNLMLTSAHQDWTDRIVAAQVAQHRMGNDRRRRVPKFFEPIPVEPRKRITAVPRFSRATRVWLVVGSAIAIIGAVLALVTMTRTNLTCSAAVLALCGCGGAVLVRYGPEHVYLARRRTATVRAIRGGAAAATDPPARATSTRFAADIDESIRWWFVTHPPLDQGQPREFAAQTAGLRTALRHDIVARYDVPDAPPVDAAGLDWLIRWHAERTARAWEDNSLYSFRDRWRTPARTRLALAAALVSVSAGSLLGLVVAAAGNATAAAGAALLLGVGTRLAAINALTIFCGQREHDDETEEHAELFRQEQVAYRLRRAELADRPKDAEMARWLAWDTVYLRIMAMERYTLTNLDVVAHFVIAEGDTDSRRARMEHGLTRYLRYTMRVFLLTANGVRALELRLDFDSGAQNDERRATFRYDAISSARIGERTVRPRGRRQAAEVAGGGPRGTLPRPVLNQALTLTLVCGEQVVIRADHGALLATENRHDADALEQVAEDTAGVVDALRLIESVAADGKGWIRRDRRRRRSRLADHTRRSPGDPGPDTDTDGNGIWARGDGDDSGGHGDEEDR